MTALKSLKPVIRLSITNPETEGHSEFGRGIANLCLGVRERGSLNSAAKSMGMAYSKAWRIIKDTEKTLGFELLDRNGAHGSVLTAEGNALLDSYLQLDEGIQVEAEKLFGKELAQRI